MRALIAAIALVFVMGATLPVADTDAKTPTPKQQRLKEKWGCSWRAAGVYTFEEPPGGPDDPYKSAEAWGWVLRCDERPRTRYFDVWLTIRHVIDGERNPVLARKRHTVRVRPSGKVQRYEERWGGLGRWSRSVAIKTGGGWCYRDQERNPTAAPIRAVLFVKPRGKPGKLRVASNPWDGPPCSTRNK